jgi:hypothetical protein
MIAHIWKTVFVNEVTSVSTKIVSVKITKAILIQKNGESLFGKECLTAIDDLIVAQGKKVDALKEHKKGLMQQLFPQPTK